MHRIPVAIALLAASACAQDYVFPLGFSSTEAESKMAANAAGSGVDATHVLLLNGRSKRSKRRVPNT